MNKNTFQFVVLLLLLSSGSMSQTLIAVQNGGNPTFFTQLDAAITAAQNGDTIYIPGGSFTIGSIINKQLHLIGVGHNPDSTIATNRTYLFGTMNLASGADGGSITGISFPTYQSIFVGYNINDFQITRCNISLISSIIYYGPSYTLSKVVFSENIINEIYCGGGQSNALFNNILGYISGIGTNNVIKNNVFLWANHPINGSASGIHNSLFENNIFIAAQTFYFDYSWDFSNNVFNNNLFVENLTFPYWTNIGSNNIVNQAQSSIFINQTGNAYSYSQNYQLQPTCLGKNAGTDGTDIGIYGGAFPWIAGSLPFNPHVQTFQVSPTTNSSGNLNVNIKVTAQNH